MIQQERTNNLISNKQYDIYTSYAFVIFLKVINLHFTFYMRKEQNRATPPLTHSSESANLTWAFVSETNDLR